MLLGLYRDVQFRLRVVLRWQHQHPIVFGSGYDQPGHARVPPSANVGRVALVLVATRVRRLEVLHSV